MSGTRTEPGIAIIGGGPGGAVAALCLQELGRNATRFERDEFPRNRIGESLLPGTLSILSRLGLHDDIEDVAYVVDFFQRPESDAITGQVIYLGGGPN